MFKDRLRKAILDFLYPTPVARVWYTEEQFNKLHHAIQSRVKDNGGSTPGFVVSFGDEGTGGIKGSYLPSKKYSGDAGWDIYCSETTLIPPMAFIDVPCGIVIDIPDGYWIRITGRSSTIRGWGLQVQEGVIDNGYTGPIFTGIQNLTVREIAVPEGTRLGQILFYRNEPIRWVFQKPREKDRSSRGFGSTGK